MSNESSLSGTAQLQEELEQFRKEKENIKHLVGQIGGTTSSRRDTMINGSFIATIVGLFIIDVVRHLGGIAVPLPPIFSVELGVLLVSIKIIWMIHKQSRVEHFQFWILNSIEYRLNGIAKTMGQIEDDLNGRRDVQ